MPTDRWFFHRIIKPMFKSFILRILAEIRKHYDLRDKENPPDPRAEALRRAWGEAIAEIKERGIPADTEMLGALGEIAYFYLNYEPHYGIFVYDIFLKHAKKYPIIFMPHPRFKQYEVEKKAQD